MSPSSGSVAVMAEPTSVPPSLFSSTESVVTVLASKDGARLAGPSLAGSGCWLASPLLPPSPDAVMTPGRMRSVKDAEVLPMPAASTV